jgi:hypothetical protein
MPISLSGGGGTSGSSSNAGVTSMFSTPFNFDSSGWVVNMGGSNTTTASGNKDANQTAQTPPAAGLAGALGGISPTLLLVAAAAFLLLRR